MANDTDFWLHARGDADQLRALQSLLTRKLEEPADEHHNGVIFFPREIWGEEVAGGWVESMAWPPVALGNGLTVGPACTNGPPVDLLRQASRMFPDLSFTLSCTTDHEQRQEYVASEGQVRQTEQRCQDARYGRVWHWKKDCRRASSWPVELFQRVAVLNDPNHVEEWFKGGEGRGLDPLKLSTVMDGDATPAAFLREEREPPLPAPEGPATKTVIYEYVGNCPVEDLSKLCFDFHGELRLLEEGVVGLSGDLGGAVQQAAMLGFVMNPSFFDHGEKARSADDLLLHKVVLDVPEAAGT